MDSLEKAIKMEYQKRLMPLIGAPINEENMKQVKKITKEFINDLEVVMFDIRDNGSYAISLKVEG